MRNGMKREGVRRVRRVRRVRMPLRLKMEKMKQL